MPDICMCDNEECPLRGNCYRFCAEPSEYRQSYSHFEYEDGECRAFWKLNDETFDKEEE